MRESNYELFKHPLILTASGSRILQARKKEVKGGETTPRIISHKLAVVALYRSDLKVQAQIETRVKHRDNWMLHQIGLDTKNRIGTKTSQPHPNRGVRIVVCTGISHFPSQSSVSNKRFLRPIQLMHCQWGLCHRKSK